MDNNKLIDKAVLENNGIWVKQGTHLKVAGPSNIFYKAYAYFNFYANDTNSDNYWIYVCNKQDYLQRARELGYVEQTGYRWGVEYETNGQRPDLPDNLEIKACQRLSGLIHFCKANKANWKDTDYFTVVDDKYKPIDQAADEIDSPLNKMSCIVDNISNINDSLPNTDESWWDWEADKAVSLPPVGSKVFFREYRETDNWKEIQIRGFWNEKGNVSVWIHSVSKPNITIEHFRPLNYATRKAEMERKRVVDAVIWALGRQDFISIANKLYDIGALNKDFGK